MEQTLTMIAVFVISFLLGAITAGKFIWVKFFGPMMEILEKEAKNTEETRNEFNK